VLALLGVSAAAAASLPLLTMAIGATQLPDLVSAPPALSSDYPKGVQVYPDGRLLLRFDGYITNSPGAPGALEIRASNPDASLVMQTVGQWTGMTSPGVGGSQVDSSGLPTPVVKFESADDHDHYHLKNAAEYTLWNQDKTAQVAIAQKTEAGFCLEDSSYAGGAGPATYTTGAAGNAFCWQHDPNHAGTLVMGISPGWKDVYGAYLTYQWIDVSNVQPGQYNLAARVDPLNVIRESDEGDNGYKFLPYTVAGYLAKPFATPQTATAKTITLDATQFGTTGARQFMILSSPLHGVLSKSPASGPFSDSTVTYTPNPGYTGADSFTYGAINNGNDGLGGNYVTPTRPNGYPLNPAAATVSLTTTVPSVAISGAPASMVAGTSVQLTSSLANLGGGVTWSASGGAITPTGLFTAPTTAGTVTVTATSTANPNVRATVTIAVAPVPVAAPAPGLTSVKAVSRALLSGVTTGHIGKRTVVGKVVTGPKTGTVTFTATINRTVLGRCSAKVPARHSFTCKVVLKRNYPLTKVLMTAQMKFGKKSVVQRSYVVKAKR